MNSRQERRARVDRWAELIDSRGLSVVTLSLLEGLDPLGFLAHQALLVVQPFVGDAAAQSGEGALDQLGGPEVWRRLRDHLSRGLDNGE